MASYLPLDSFNITEIGADRAEISSKKLGKTAYLIAGDALATVDPITGLGCNTAIQSASFFEELLSGFENRQSLDTLLHEYDRQSDDKINYIHSESKSNRQIYRPDAV